MTVLTGMEEVDLTGCILGEAGVEILCNAMSKPRSCPRALYLPNNFLRDEAAVSLSALLKSNCRLTLLDLQQNGIRDAGASALGVALVRNTTLLALSLRYNNISDAGINGLSDGLIHNTTLRTLNLGVNQFQRGGLLSLSRALGHNTTLTELDLYRVPFEAGCASAFSAALRAPSSLTSINLGTCSLSPTDAATIASGIRVSPSLLTIDLSMNSIGNAGVVSIATALAVNPTLTSLNLSLCNVSDDGSSALAIALKTNRNLRVLNLRLNRMRDPEPMEAVLRQNTTLTDLNIEDNIFPRDSIGRLMEAAQFNFSLRALKIDESELVTRFCTVLLERNVLAEETWGQRAHWFHLITRHFRARTEGLSVPASGSSLDSSRSPVAGAWLADSGDVMRTLLTSRRMTMCDGRRVCSSVANAIASFL